MYISVELSPVYSIQAGRRSLFNLSGVMLNQSDYKDGAVISKSITDRSTEQLLPEFIEDEVQIFMTSMCPWSTTDHSVQPRPTPAV